MRERGGGSHALKRFGSESNTEPLLYGKYGNVKTYMTKETNSTGKEGSNGLFKEERKLWITLQFKNHYHHYLRGNDLNYKETCRRVP